MEFKLTERTEPLTLKEVLDFIDDTNISKKDAHELKSRIVDVVLDSEDRVIDEFAERLKNHLNEFDFWKYGISDGTNYETRNYDHMIDKIAEQMKKGE
jgi:hypothetical protein